MVMSEGDFLEAMQKLIFGNAMTSTYKLALIRAIVELVTGQPAAKEGELICIPYTALADAFLRIYWNQGRDYLTAPGKACKLAQSANQHDGVLRIQTLIKNFTDKVGPLLPAHESLTWYRASQLPKKYGSLQKEYGSLQKEYCSLQKACIREVLIKNPLAYITEHEFLFTDNRQNSRLEIDAGIARYICRFYPFLMELTESRWETLLRSLEKNTEVLGGKYGQSLRDFLFHSEERESLEKVRNFLWGTLGQQTCFYCGATLGEKDAQADHFIPFSLYQDTKVFNFVLSCGRCNASKSNYLASADHVEHWMQRNREQGEFIIRRCPESLDPGAALSANRAHMLYQRAQEKHDLLWRKRALEYRESPLMVTVSAGLVGDLARYAQFMNRLELGMSETDFAAPHLKGLENTS